MRKMQKRNIIIHALFVITVALLILTEGVAYNNAGVYAASGDKAITETVPMTEAAFSYLDEVYVKRFPGMATEPSYGSYRDIEELRTKAAEITANCSTDKEKTEAVIKWVISNITYDEGYLSCCFPIDVYHHRVGVCFGYASLIQELLRLSDVPAVVGAGYHGNMKKLTFGQLLDDEYKGHAWIYVYYGNEWHLYDPLMGEYDITDRSYIANHYAVLSVEGVLPYYEGLDVKKVTGGGTAIILKDGRFQVYYDNAADIPGSTFNYANAMMCYRSDIKDREENCGMDYLNKPGATAKMQVGECFSDGWMADDRGYAMGNGIFKAASIAELDGNPYYLSTEGFATKISREMADNCTFELGVPVFGTGDTYYYRPDWCESEQEEGRVIVYELYDKNHNPDFGYDGKAKVDKDGNITMLSPGRVQVNVTSRDSYDDEGCYYNSSLDIYIKKDFADCKITIKPVADQTYTGKPITPEVKITADGKKLMEHEDYVLDYSGNIKKGTAKIRITGTGNYKGSTETSFKIRKNTAGKAQPMKLKGKTLKIKAKTIKKKSLTFDAGKLIRFTKKARGAKTYRITGVSKSNYKKYFKIDSDTGELTVKEGLKKGTYKLTVKVKAAGDDKYKPGSKKAVIKIVVK